MRYEAIQLGTIKQICVQGQCRLHGRGGMLSQESTIQTHQLKYRYLQARFECPHIISILTAQSYSNTYSVSFARVYNSDETKVSNSSLSSNIIISGIISSSSSSSRRRSLHIHQTHQYFLPPFQSLDSLLPIFRSTHSKLFHG